MHTSSPSPMPSASSHGDVLRLRERVVAFAELTCSPRALADDALLASTYDALAERTRLRLTLDDWVRRLLADRSRELEQRLEVLTARLAEGGRRARRGDDVAALLDHRAGPRVIEVDVGLASPVLAACSVVLAIGDHPLHATRPGWWVLEHGAWAPTDIAADDVAGSAELGATPADAAGAEGFRWVLSNSGWEQTHRF